MTEETWSNPRKHLSSILWLNSLLKKTGQRLTCPTVFLEDNTFYLCANEATNCWSGNKKARIKGSDPSMQQNRRHRPFYSTQLSSLSNSFYITHNAAWPPLSTLTFWHIEQSYPYFICSRAKRKPRSDHVRVSPISWSHRAGTIDPDQIRVDWEFHEVQPISLQAQTTLIH